MRGRAPSYLVALRLEGRCCLVVGGGKLAGRKAEGLLGSGAEVTVVAPEIDPDVEALPVRLVKRRFEPEDLDGCWLVCAAADDPADHEGVLAEAARRCVLVNAADDVEACSFFLPAVTRRGAVTVAVSTDGASPALAAAIRDRIAGLLPDEVAHLAERLGDARRALRAAGRSPEPDAWRKLAGELVEAATERGSTAGLTSRVDARIDAFIAAGGRAGRSDRAE